MLATLLLEDGTVLTGRGIGTKQESIGEVVFNTAMTGYEEVISDPSYSGQIVLFTSSHIGNTGINLEDLESNKMYAQGMICKNISSKPDNFRSKKSLEEFLIEQNKCAIYGIDTRMLTQKLRKQGCLMGILSTSENDIEKLKIKLKNAPRMSETNIITHYERRKSPEVSNKDNLVVAVIDCGIKQGILNSLIELGCTPKLFDYNVTAAEIQAIHPDGLFFSNGPGDPEMLAKNSNLISVIQELAPQYPTFGICMGHQLIGRAFGAKINKLNFGHHAINHPVKSLNSKNSQVLITSQNHNYVVDIENCKNILEATYLHLNDGTLAGLKHKSYPIFSVQFHPESNPGPRDAEIIFKDFLKAMQDNKKTGNK